MAAVTIVKTDLSSQLPSWFKPVPGLKFRDRSGNPHMVIGWGGWRHAEIVTHNSPFGLLEGAKIKFEPCGLLYVFLYKGEWHMGEIEKIEQESLSGWQPGWEEGSEENLSGWR